MRETCIISHHHHLGTCFWASPTVLLLFSAVEYLVLHTSWGTHTKAWEWCLNISHFLIVSLFFCFFFFLKKLFDSVSLLLLERKTKVEPALHSLHCYISQMIHYCLSNWVVNNKQDSKTNMRETRKAWILRRNILPLTSLLKWAIIYYTTFGITIISPRLPFISHL